MVIASFCTEIKDGKVYSLADLYKDEHRSLTLEELRSKAKELSLTVTPDICKNVEEMTRKQSESKLWFEHRAGRITASKFKNACCTTIEKPAISTIKSICYPYEMKFTSKQTAYGCAHEKEALEAYRNKVSTTHENFKVHTTGFYISPSYPHFGASPDAIISCDCCGQGCVEIKCPFCSKDSSIAEALPKYIKKSTDNLQLKTNHLYFYQIQMQMAICNKLFCDFVVWSKNDLYIERITFNKEFWKTESLKATRFWTNVIVPELLGKYYTSRHISATCNSKLDSQSSTSATDVPPQPRAWCICQNPDDSSKTIKCDNVTCPVEWFHMKCLNMKRLRKSWLCATCKPSSR